jgi:hypothetical protein
VQAYKDKGLLIELHTGNTLVKARDETRGERGEGGALLNGPSGPIFDFPDAQSRSERWMDD